MRKVCCNVSLGPACSIHATKTFSELGKAVKTIFLCRHLHSAHLRREVSEGLNVVESWNPASDFIMIGKGGERTSNRPEDQDISLLCLHLLPSSLTVIINNQSGAVGYECVTRVCRCAAPAEHWPALHHEAVETIQLLAAGASFILGRTPTYVPELPQVAELTLCATGRRA
jgi:hypothetical protein